MSAIHIRKATAEDLPSVYRLIKALALYEKEPDEPTISLEEFVRDGSGNSPKYHVIIAKKQDEVIGIALYYLGYSTWKGRMMYLDDLVVQERYRKQGIGSKLFDALVEAARNAEVNQLRWHVLDWNEPAIKFYEKIGASLDPEWITCKFEKERL